MGKFLKKFGLTIPVAIVGIIWCMLVLVFANYEKAKFFFWGGFAFGLLTFIITSVVAYLISTKTTNTTVELTAPVYKFTSIYLILGVLMNTIYVIISDGKNGPKWVIVTNVIVLLVYAGAMVFALKATTRVSQLGTTISKRVVSVQMFGVTIGGMLDATENPNVKAQLTQLKEYVDYSDQTGAEATKEIEDRFRTILFDIQTMIDEGEPEEEILKKIKSATSTWKTRNSMLATLR